MNREALSMAKHLTGAIARNEVNAQYHWANLIMLDALAQGAKGPEPTMDLITGICNDWRLAQLDPGRSMGEDAIEESRR